MRRMITFALLAGLVPSTACEQKADPARAAKEQAEATPDSPAPAGSDRPLDEPNGRTQADAAAAAAADQERIASLPAYREVTIPAGTRLSFRLRTPVASDANAVEDRVRATLRKSVAIDGVTALPAGAPVDGVITSAKPSARVKGLASVAFRFTSITLNDQPLSIRTSAIRQRARGTKARDAKTIGIPAAGGAIVGGVIGGKKGAVIGGAAGGGAGTAVVLSTRGEEARLPVGTVVAARLAEPLTVRVPVQP
jgi:hypothetical protein